MIIITAVNKHGKEVIIKYIGNIVVWRSDSFIMVESTDTSTPGWSANRYDGYFPEDVVSIRGVDGYE
jgi:hypothetical protein